MNEPLLNKVPVIRRGFRLQFEPAQGSHVLLYPEGMIKLNESASAILSRVDGVCTVAEVVAALQQQFPDVQGIDEDILAFFEVAHAQFWIEFR